MVNIFIKSYKVYTVLLKRITCIHYIFCQSVCKLLVPVDRIKYSVVTKKKFPFPRKTKISSLSGF